MSPPLIQPQGGGPAKSIRETSGPTVLTVGAVADGEYLKRDGTTVVGATVSAGTALQDMALFGDGSDGVVSISAGTTTLTRPMFYSTLTISGTGAISTASYPVCCSVECDLSNAPAGALSYPTTNGGNGATAGTGGPVGGNSTFVFLPVAPTGVSQSGGAGGTGAGSQASNVTATAGQIGGGNGASGAGGSGSGGSGGAGRSATSLATTALTLGNARDPLAVWLRGASTSLTTGIPGQAGGGGGGDGTSGAGGGGSPQAGNFVGLWAKQLRRGASTAAGAIRALGGTGGSGGAATAGNRGGGGGASGGGGGVVYVVVGGLVGASATSMLDAAGGTGGNGGAGFGTGTSGTGGQGGCGGVCILFNLGTSTITKTDARTTTGSAASGTTGGAGAACSLTV